MEPIILNINGKDHHLMIKKGWTLLYVLREILNFTGTKAGCETGACGACKVLVEGEAFNSCSVLARNMVGKTITTIEGVASDGELHVVQEAFIEAGAVQCGFCTPGMIISTIALLQHNPCPERKEIAKALDNNLCRCTGYIKIFDAVELASRKMSERGIRL